MTARRLATLVLLAVVGVAGGFGLAAVLEDDDPTRIEDAAPVAATSPEIPSNPEIEVLDDPDFPALKPNLPMRTAKIGIKPFMVRLPVPDGWAPSIPASGEWRWYPPDAPNNTYFLRVRQVSNRYQPVASALTERIGDLDSASDVLDFEVTSRSGDTFVGDYVSNGYRRVAMESFLDLNGDGLADVWVAVLGRERDRSGLTDLLSGATSGVEPAG